MDYKKILIRAGLVAAAVWVTALMIPSWIAKAVAGALTLLGAGALYWLFNYTKRAQAIGSLLQEGTDTEEGRKAALAKLDAEFKKDDAQAVIAKAHLLAQEDPRAALTTLEGINLDKQIAPVAGQVRAMRAMFHLTLGEPQEARPLVDKLDLGKQQDVKTRAMFATVAAETWARTGNAQKAVDTLDLFNPEDPAIGEVRPQMWRARAFAYAAANDTKGVQRALKKLIDINPHLLGMFVGQKKMHPLLEREAKQLAIRSSVIPKKMQRQRI